MKTIGVALTRTEVDHLLTLLRDNSTEGSYYGARRQYLNRAARLLKKMETAYEDIIGREGRVVTE